MRPRKSLAPRRRLSSDGYSWLFMAPTRSQDLAKILAEGDAPVYVLDEERVIAYCNPACAEWLSVKASEVIGQECVYHTPDHLNASHPTAGLCPQPQVFSGQAQSAVVWCARPDGSIAYRRGQFLPLADRQDESSPVLAVLELRDC